MTGDYAYLMRSVADILLGVPNEQLSTRHELRYHNKGSLSIDLDKGTYFDHENNEGGGVLDLIKRETGEDPITWIKKQGLYTTSRNKQAISYKPNNNSDFALSLWRASIPAAGTLVEVYLRSRAITIPPPPTLRFHPTLRHNPSGTIWPAMVALVTRDKALLGVHRTYLARDGNGKAPIEPQKMALGPIASGAVRLGPVACKLYIAEGIETALTIMQAMSGTAWATLGTSGMKALELPPEVREVVMCADSGAAGEAAAREAGWRFKWQGRAVKIARPPAGKDFNDILCEETKQCQM